MIDLYGQCVQISIYDEDYQGSQVVQVPSELESVPEAVPVTQDSGTSMCFKYRVVGTTL